MDSTSIAGFERALAEPAPKAFRLGAHRICSPDETLARVGPHARAMGITRIGNVTGLDDIGIPVAVAVRPKSRSVSVSQGKGATVEQARVSALMEAAEGFHGEDIAHRFRKAPWRDLGREGAAVDPASLCGIRRAPGDRVEIPWIEGYDLLAGSPCWAPAEIVHTDCASPLPPDGGYFLSGSNGLASGNHLIEAIVAGLCELIERDAAALWNASGLLARARRRLDLATVDDPGCRALLAKYEAAGIRPSVWDATSDIGVATFICDIPASPSSHAPDLRRFRGAGCHPDRAVALARALTEAAQTRLNRIVGIRDDLTEEGYVETPATRGGGALLDAASRAAPGLSFQASPQAAAADLGADLNGLLGRLRAAGIRRVVVVDLTRAELGIPVVRVIAPGLEWDCDHPGYGPGPRARRASEVLG